MFRFDDSKLPQTVDIQTIVDAIPTDQEVNDIKSKLKEARQRLDAENRKNAALYTKHLCAKIATRCVSNALLARGGLSPKAAEAAEAERRADDFVQLEIVPRPGLGPLDGWALGVSRIPDLRRRVLLWRNYQTLKQDWSDLREHTGRILAACAGPGVVIQWADFRLPAWS